MHIPPSSSAMPLGSSRPPHFSGQTTQKPVLGERFDDALAYARQLHNTQTRKGTVIPYVSHLMSVAAIALEHGATEEEAIAALLHDAVEDQGGKETLAEIHRRFGETVARLVEACSDAEGQVGEAGQAKPPWKNRKQAYIDHLRTAEEPALLISAADKLHNAQAILNDFRDQGDMLFYRFNAGKEDVLWYYGELTKGFENAQNLSPRIKPLVRKLAMVVGTLRQEASAQRH